jgi:hypothetical protein
MRRETKGMIAGRCSSIGIMVFLLVLLVMIPSLRAAEVQPEKTPPQPRFERASLVLKDNKTGLVWPLNADIAGRTFSWGDAQDYVVRLNLEKYAGFSDWRVPSLEEIESLIEHVRTTGFMGGNSEGTVASRLQEMGVQNVQSEGYWTSTTNIYYSAEAWYVAMTNGTGSVGDKALYFSLWPVRFSK